jgi:hypothetical protein
MSKVGVALLLLFSLTGCDDSPDRQPAAERVPGAADVIKATDDVRIAATHALYRVFTSPAAADEAEASRVRVTAEEGANYLTGQGRFHLELHHFALPTDSPFAERYTGYVLNGEIWINSSGYGGTYESLDLQLTHPYPQRFPVRKMHGKQTEAGFSLQVNGREVDGRLLLSDSGN